MHPALRSLEQPIIELLSRQTAAGSPWLSLALPLPSFDWQPALSVEQPHVYWAQAAQGLQRVGLGRIAETRIGGYGQLAGLAAARRALAAGHCVVGPCAEDIEDPLFVAFPFNAGADAPGHEARLFLPEVTIDTTATRDRLLLSCARADLVQPERPCQRWLQMFDELVGGGLRGAPAGDWQPVDGGRAAERWQARVERALEAIATGELHKVVLTRSIRLVCRGQKDLGAVIARLTALEQNATVFSISDGREALIGASPEHLGLLRGKDLSVDALAGTCPIDAMIEPRPAPVVTSKLALEHGLVVHDIEQALSTCCEDIIRPDQPLWKPLANCAHLWTPFHARLRDGFELLDVADRLHPTAAIAGAPRAQAAAWLERHRQETGRGWYTGGLGWLNARGGGELIVALRCALICAEGAELYAGAGIVSGSDPATEFSETEWKLRTMLKALNHYETATGETRH